MMVTRRATYTTALAVVGLLASYRVNAQNAITIDNDDIGGVVTSAKVPEAGVWVIAETTDLGTKMSRSVVTDDAGRYVIPDLPPGKYKVWCGCADTASLIRRRSTASPANIST
jgi:hypothetical protein